MAVEPIAAADPAAAASPRPGLALLGAALLAALLAAAATWLLLRPPGEASPEVRFARDMSFHHEQAVEMALIIRGRTEDPALRAFADDIILTQQNQIGQMSGWLASWGRPLAGAEPPMAGMGLMMGMAAQPDVNSLRDLPAAEAEVRFLQLMTSHHQGGVFMAEDVLAAGPRPEVRRLAEAIVAGQTNEIRLMAEMLAARGAQPPPPLERMDHAMHSRAPPHSFGMAPVRTQHIASRRGRTTPVARRYVAPQAA